MSQNHIVQLPAAARLSSKESINPGDIAQEWLTALQSALQSSSSSSASSYENLFHPDGWWRDHLALQWDFRTLRSAASISSFLAEFQPTAKLSNLTLQTEGKYVPHVSSPENQLDFVASMFFFESHAGRGTGILRLLRDEGATGEWKAYAVYTSLQELKGAEEPLGPKRVYGTLDSMPGGLAGGTWAERRKKQAEFVGAEPVVLVVGAGI
jgi:hypothetical protein